MAAPTVIARTTPTGYKLPEGFKATIAFSKKPALNIWEVETAPSGMEVTEINTTTQHNIRYVSKYPSYLVANDDITGTAGYDPDVMDDLVSLLGDPTGSFTIHMPDGTTHSYWGFAKSFKFQPLRVGQFPLLTYTLCVTNYDPVNKVEAGVSTVQAAGT